MWPFKKKVPKYTSFPVGIYRLSDQIDTIEGLVELSEAEYQVMTRNFDGEHIYKAPTVMFIGRPWNMMLGAVHGRIYKLAPYLEMGDKQEANRLAFDALSYCRSQLGKPSQQETGLFIWDTIDGNVILQTADAADGFAINLFITSNAVRTPVRI